MFFTPRRSITVANTLKPGCTMAPSVGMLMLTVGGGGGVPTPSAAVRRACEFWVVPPQMQSSRSNRPHWICLLRKNLGPQPPR